MKALMVYITAGSMEEAKKVGDYLVDKRLAACVNIIDGMQSVYRWKGALQNDREVVVIAKTLESKVSALVEAVKSTHGYEVPCVVCLPIVDGNPEFLQWIADEVEDASS